MEERYTELLKEKCTETSYRKLMALDNAKLHDFVGKYAELCNPDSIFVGDDSDEDAQYIRDKSLETGEEGKLAVQGHTIHYDGYNDQARDKAQTKYLLSEGMELGASLNTIDKEKGIREVHEYLKDSMAGKEMLVLFFCLGPTNSEFSIPCAQITDSSYVAHSEYILYRKGYKQFERIGNSESFFRIMHSAGALENMVSRDVDKRRVYMDLEENIVYSTNTQYAGNTVGLKKLSLRLAIHKASGEGWLAEHMLVMGVHGPDGRVTYFTGAYPSACGKTSTAMMSGESIVGDDIAYLRHRDGKVYAVNVENGIFGIIQNVNAKDDPLIWEVLTSSNEVIFSNVLVTEDKIPFWLGDKREIPESGINYSGKWIKGKKDSKGIDITHSHKNARYTVKLRALKNLDPKLDDAQGAETKGIIYGGRDSNTWSPVQQSFDWAHGVITMGASLESETTSATLGQEGVRQFCPMSNIDFVSVSIGKYISNHLKFADSLDSPPAIFAANYFLKDSKSGEYVTGMQDKRVWVKWMELRVNNDVDAIKTPTGFIPKYEDLKKLFKQVLDTDYAEEEYIKQFTLRIPENLQKIERITEIYKTKVSDTPDILFDILEEQKKRLKAAQEKYGDYVAPELFCK